MFKHPGASQAAARSGCGGPGRHPPRPVCREDPLQLKRGKGQLGPTRPSCALHNTRTTQPALAGPGEISHLSRFSVGNPCGSPSGHLERKMTVRRYRTEMPFFLLNHVSVCTGDKETVSRPPEMPKGMEMWHREECTRTQHGNPAGTEPCALPRAGRRVGCAGLQCER